MRHWLKIGLLVLAFAGTSYAIGGPPAGSPILNSPVYQKNTQAIIDTFTVVGILQIPYGSSTPPSYLCNAATHTARIFVVSSTTAGGSAMWVCEGVNGWQVKTSSGGTGGGSAPGGLDGYFQYKNGSNFSGSADLITNGSTITVTNIRASTVTVTNYSRFENVSTTTWQSVSTVTFKSGILIDMSGIANANLGEGLVIPQGTDCSQAVRNGQICWDNDDHFLYMGNGTGIQPPMTAGAANLGVSDGPVLITTPTALINLNKDQFDVAAVAVTTATIALNTSSVTLQGNTFNGASQLAKLDALSVLTLSSASFTHAYQSGFLTLPILQFRSGTTTSSTLTTSPTFTDTALTVSITPRLATSKVFILASGASCMGAGGSGFYTISRSGTNLGGTNGLAGIVSNNCENITLMAYDSPATTSALSYTVQMRSPSSIGMNFPTSNFGAPNPTATIIAVEVAQ